MHHPAEALVAIILLHQPCAQEAVALTLLLSQVVEAAVVVTHHRLLQEVVLLAPLVAVVVDLLVLAVALAVADPAEELDKQVFMRSSFLYQQVTL